MTSAKTRTRCEVRGLRCEVSPSPRAVFRNDLSRRRNPEGRLDETHSAPRLSYLARRSISHLIAERPDLDQHAQRLAGALDHPLDLVAGAVADQRAADRLVAGGVEAVALQQHVVALDARLFRAGALGHAG